MKTLVLLAIPGLFVASFALGDDVPKPAPGAVLLDTVEAQYVPTDTNGTGKDVFVDAVSFEINPENGRVRAVVDYDYDESSIYSRNDDGGGPQSTHAVMPELTYDAGAHSVVYRANGKQTVCATVDSNLETDNTGACTVSALLTDHPVDDGWEVHHHMMLDVYFQAR